MLASMPKWFALVVLAACSSGHRAEVPDGGDGGSDSGGGADASGADAAADHSRVYLR